MTPIDLYDNVACIILTVTFTLALCTISSLGKKSGFRLLIGILGIVSGFIFVLYVMEGKNEILATIGAIAWSIFALINFALAYLQYIRTA